MSKSVIRKQGNASNSQAVILVDRLQRTIPTATWRSIEVSDNTYILFFAFSYEVVYQDVL